MLEVMAIGAKFQSTLPAWGATAAAALGLALMRFQSTLPAWGATTTFISGDLAIEFQSTLPAWGATAAKAAERKYHYISIHAPRVGSDNRQTLRAR